MQAITGYLILAPLCLLSPQLTHEQQDERGPGFGPEAARRFLASLDETQRRAAKLPFESPDRLRWRRDPSARPGVAAGVLSDVQRRHLGALLVTVLSDAGIATVDGIRREQDTLGRDEEGLGHGYFWMAVYGEPGRGAWSWRFGGHHISVHVHYEENRLRSLLPLMLGGERCGAGDADCPGYVAVRNRETLARQIAQACDADTWNEARVPMTGNSMLELSEPSSRPFGQAKGGVPLAQLSATQKRDMDALIQSYVSVLQPSLARLLAGEFEDAARARFAWAGDREPGRPHYYRILAPGLLIEYVNTGAHMHTLMRADMETPATGAPSP